MIFHLKHCKFIFLVILYIISIDQSFAATEIELFTHKISPDENYQVFITHNGSDYSGRLDYELYKCDLDFTNLIHVMDEWVYEAIEGVATTEPNQNFPTGLYLVRFKPYAAANNDFSNFEILMVDDQPTLHPIVYSGETISLPPPGSYMIFESYNSQDQFVGYSRIDIETDQAPFGGHAMRMTKTAEDAYWNAGWPNVIRFGIDKITSGDPFPDQWIVSPGWSIHSTRIRQHMFMLFKTLKTICIYCIDKRPTAFSRRAPLEIKFGMNRSTISNPRTGGTRGAHLKS